MTPIKRKKNAPLHLVKQLLSTDSIEAANNLLVSEAWILVETCKRKGTTFYVLGRINEYESGRKTEQNEENE